MNKFIEVTSLRSGMNSLDRDRNMPHCAFAEIEIPNIVTNIKNIFFISINFYLFVLLTFRRFGYSVHLSV